MHHPPDVGERHASPPNPLAAQLRPATRADIPELVRLRALMFDAMGVDSSGAAWQQAFVHQLHERLDPSGSVAGFVVDDPNRPGRLAACGLGVITDRFPGAFDVTGRVGYLASMVTVPEHRRRGLGAEIVAALIDWFASRDVRTIELHAMPRAVPMYRAAGFTEPSCQALSWYNHGPAARSVEPVAADATLATS
jgi:GNAT superfamily N-acetyltransferase